MSYKVAVCDDNSTEANYISALVDKWAKQKNISIYTDIFPSAEAFLFYHDNCNIFDILLLDIEMGTLSGIDLAKIIRKSDKRAEIVFITSHFEFIGEGYEVDTLHYLVKPLQEEKLYEVLNRAVEHLSVEPASLIINCNGESIKLTEDKIVYVESFLHYICIHTANREYRIKESISVFKKRLTDRFFRIHRSYIVSLSHIICISRFSITIEGGISLPLSRGLYDDVNRAFIQYN